MRTPPIAAPSQQLHQRRPSTSTRSTVDAKGSNDGAQVEAQPSTSNSASGPSSLPTRRSSRRLKAQSTAERVVLGSEEAPPARTRLRSSPSEKPSPHARSRSVECSSLPTSDRSPKPWRLARQEPPQDASGQTLTVAEPSSPSLISPASTSDSSASWDSPPSSPDATEQHFRAQKGAREEDGDDDRGAERREGGPRKRTKSVADLRVQHPPPSPQWDPRSHRPTSTKLHTLVASEVGPITGGAIASTVCLSLLAQADLVHLLPASPAHLLHPGQHYPLEYINAFCSPLLVSNLGSALGLGLGVANLAGLHVLERSTSPTCGTRVQLGLAAGAWSAIIALRVLLSWVFGRVLGFAHPEWFSTAAIHQIFSGLGPLLLAMFIIRSIARPARPPSAPLVLLLAANFLCPLASGGSGPWIGLSAVVVGLLLALALLTCQNITDSTSTAPQPRSGRRLSTTLPSWLLQIATLLLIPALATLLPTPSRTLDLDTSFSALHPAEAHLLTILLMTAPRPGNPDYLVQSVESWLGALPDPDTAAGDAASRVRLVVYTHFGKHETFDRAWIHFADHPLYGRKAERYVEWYRDPRGQANRLDQRLHVARGLAYAATSGGASAYVLLAEDDFPLCPDEDPVEGVTSTWHNAWRDLQLALVETNEAMPDYVSVPPERAALGLEGEEGLSGHCGVFLTTGGSGLAIRGFIAAQLPALLLGADDPAGDARDGRLARGEFSVKAEDEGADTPDVVIQDCLRGRHAGCEVCAAPSAGFLQSAGPFPPGSVRNPRSLPGERWGKSGLTGSRRLLQHHLGYNASTLPGRKYGKEEWACGWRQPFNGEPDVLTL